MATTVTSSNDLYNIEAEETLIGILLQVPENYSKIENIVKFGDFYNQNCARLFEIIVDLINSNTPVNLQNVKVQLIERKLLERVPFKTVSSMLQKTTALGAIEIYARKVKEWSVRRAYIDFANKSATMATLPTVDPLSLLRYARGSVENQYSDYERLGYGRLGFMGWDSVLDPSYILSSTTRLEALEARAKNLTNPRPPLYFGFQGLDNPLNEEDTVLLPRRRLCVLVAASSVGKTSATLQIACANAAAGSHVGYFHNELDKEEMRLRIDCRRANIPYMRLHRHFTGQIDLTPDEEARLIKATKEWEKWPGSIEFQDIAEKTVDDVRRVVYEMSQARKEAHALELKSMGLDPKMARGFDLVIIDYVTLLNETRGHEGDYNKYDITQLGNLSVDSELDLSVIAIVQLGKDKGDGKDENGNDEYTRPSGSNFMGSQFIKNRSNVMIGFTRKKKDNGGNGVFEGELIVLKNGSGPANFSIQLEYVAKRFMWRDAGFASFGPTPLPNSNYQPALTDSF